MAEAAPEHYAHCEALLRERARDLWLAALFVPAAERPHVHAVYAYALECAEVRAKVSQPLLGEMRLRWWTDALTAAGNESAQPHPVADALRATIDACGLPRDELVALADAHVADLYDDPIPDLATLEYYCRMTVAGPIRWSARILGVAPSPAFDAAGLALGLTRVLERPAGAFLPADLLAAAGADINAASPALRDVARGVADRARAHYESARTAAAGLTRGREALLPAAIVPLYLEQTRQKTYDPTHGLAPPSPLRRQWRLWRAARGAGL
jgi:phytoene synthase